MADKLQDTISNLRAIIISSKGGLALCNVQNDYEEAFGETVPFKELGYSNLRDLFEKNPSEFHLIGDKVNVEPKSNSAHIRSLVSRQKSKTKSLRSVKNGVKHRSSKRKQDFSHEGQQRFSKENNDKNSTFAVRENSKHQAKTDSIEKITLRKPMISGFSEVINPYLYGGMTPKTPSKEQENTKPLKPTTNTVPSDRIAKSKELSPKVQNSDVPHYTELFQDVKDLPPSSAQIRLLNQKSKMLQDLKTWSIKENPTASTKNSECKEKYFDLNPIAPLRKSLEPGVQSPSSHRPVESNPIKDFKPKPTTPYCNQKAQARIALIQSSVQKLVQNMDVQQKETNQKTNKTNLQSERNVGDAPFHEGELKRSDTEGGFGSASMLKPTTSFEIINNQRPQTNASESARDLVGKGTAICPQNEQLNIQDSEHIVKLKELCKVRGFLEPCFKLIVRESKNEPKHFICKVQIEDYLQISSYPLETQDPLMAKEIAAKKMYNYCIGDETFRKKNTENEDVLVRRILDMVSTAYGLWSDKLPILYSNTYQEEITENWFDIIRKTSLFEIDNFDDKRYIIRKKMDSSDSEHFTSQKSRQNVRSDTPHLPDLSFPKSEQWEIYITNVNNSEEIWCRLIGENYSDAYDTMMTKLELEPPERKTKKPKIGDFYSIKVSAIWYRVKLEELVNEKEGLVFYIDIGDKDVVNLADLFEPHDVFYSIAPQAIKLSLFELESFSDDEELTSFIANHLLGNTYIGEIVTELKYSQRGRRTVKLWDTSTERDINVNQLLLNNIIKNIRTPSLPNATQIKEVLVSSINENGDIHIQTDQKSVHRLECLVSNKIKSLEGRPTLRKTDDTIGTDIVYLTKCKGNDSICRAKLTEIQNLDTVDVSFIDYGFTERVSVSALIHLERTSILQAIPAQAIKVRLGNMTFFSRNIVTELRETILNKSVLMKVLTSNRGAVPSVEIFRRSNTGNTLYSVNMKISNDPGLKDDTVPARRRSVVVGLEKVLPKNLPAPDVPGIGQHFEVFVTLASSPDLFIVQPLSSRMQLMKMMNELQEAFARECKRIPRLNVDEITVGELYAVLHPDGNWYRGCVQAVVGSYNYSIFMCDFGDCIMVTRDKLMPLPETYRTFPYQAIRATLLGIPPENRDWAPSDCINFYKLVVEKYFVSTIMQITRDERNPNYISLGLILTDTSGDEDVYIHKVLMDKKNEVYTLMNG